MPETSTPTLIPDGTTKFPAFQNNNPGNVEVDALKAYILSQAGLANGLATLDAEGKLDSSQIPVNLDDVLVYPSYASLPATGETGKLYITSDVNGTYYWNGTSYQVLNQSFVRYRGSLSSLPSDAQPGDWFIAASSFSSYTSGHIYLYNGSSWDDVTAVFGQFVLKTDIAQTIGNEIDKVPSNAAVNSAINAIIGSTMPFKYVDGTFNNMNNLPLGVVTVDFANMANVPSGGWGYGVVITAKIADNSNFKTQTAYCTKGSSAGEKNIFMRQQWGGTWGDWERLVRETDIQHVNYPLSVGSDSGPITIQNGHCDVLFNTDWSDSAVWLVLRGSYGGRVVILKSSTATSILTVAFTSDSTYKISNPSGFGTVVHRVSL